MKKSFLIILLCALNSVTLFAQQITLPDVKNRPTTTALQTENSPEMDGEVINDEFWKSITPITTLIQTKPASGQEVSEPTHIRLAYNQSTFFLSVICYDKTPDKLVVSDMRRDANLMDTDAFLFILDTYHDSQNGFMFGTNSLGIEYDAQVNNEGQGNFNNNRQQGGVIGGFNLNWDASWEVKTQVGEYGWSAEFAIPFRTLRFKAGENQTWGINFQRNIRKTNEIAYWASLPIEFDLKRLSLEGNLTGLNIENQGNLKLIPYSLVNFSKAPEGSPNNTLTEDQVGLDIKYSITPNMTLDLTYNTDFAQVEVDEQQVNLDRFNLFFPEKRPFFLENAGLFSMGSPGEIDLFFSRKIGIGRDTLGQNIAVPILGGARLSGRINNTNVGFLNIATDDSEIANLSKNNYTVARVDHQIGQRSALGLGFINRDGLIPDSTDYNRVFVMDGKLGIGKKAQLSGFFSKSATANTESDGNDVAFNFKANYEWNGLMASYAVTDVGNEFNPEVGFLARNDGYIKHETLVLKRIRPENNFGLLELRPHVSYRGYWDADQFLVGAGFQQTGYLHVDNHWEFKKGFEIHTGMNFTKEGVTESFFVNKIDSELFVDTGTYTNKEVALVVMTNTSKPLYFSTRTNIGGYYSGNRVNSSGSVGFRIGDSFNAEIKYGLNKVDIENNGFFTQVYGTRVSYSFTPRMNLQGLVQYNSTLDLYSINVRYSLIQQANTGLFLVYNQLNSNGNILSRALTLKYSHVIDLIR